MITYATDENYEELVKDGVVGVDFFGKTCVPCKMLAKVLEEVDDEFPFVNIVKVDVDDCPQTSERFEVNGIPDIYFYKDGKIAAHDVGFGNKQTFMDRLSEVLYS